ncbi:MAG: nuclear transport factor 2 family protein, partial [Mycobacteriaceae bacterium]
MAISTQAAGSDLVAQVERFRHAYLRRDVAGMLSLFSEDAELVAAPGVFRGKDAIKKFFQWDADLSPTVTVDDVGIGVAVAGQTTVVWERVIHLTYEGIPYHEDAVTIVEFDDSGLIRRYRSYYDKLAVVDQVASGLPGAA